jgi:hypothetical protein
MCAVAMPVLVLVLVLALVRARVLGVVAHEASLIRSA